MTGERADDKIMYILRIIYYGLNCVPPTSQKIHMLKAKILKSQNVTYLETESRRYN